MSGCGMIVSVCGMSCVSVSVCGMSCVCVFERMEHVVVRDYGLNAYIAEKLQWFETTSARSFLFKSCGLRAPSRDLADHNALQGYCF